MKNHIVGLKQPRFNRHQLLVSAMARQWDEILLPPEFRSFTIINIGMMFPAPDTFENLIQRRLTNPLEMEQAIGGAIMTDEVMTIHALTKFCAHLPGNEDNMIIEIDAEGKAKPNAQFFKAGKTPDTLTFMWEFDLTRKGQVNESGGNFLMIKYGEDSRECRFAVKKQDGTLVRSLRELALLSKPTGK